MSSILTLESSFPSQTLPELVAATQIDWRESKSFETAFDALETIQSEAIKAGEGADQLTQGMVTDIVHLKTRFPDSSHILNLLQLAVCYKMMDHTMLSKELPLLWKWTIQSLHDVTVIDRVENFDPFNRVVALDGGDQVFAEYRELYLNYWLIPFYYSARENGHPFQGLASAMFRNAIVRGMRSIRRPTHEAVIASWILIMAYDWEVMLPGPRMEPEAFKLLHQWYRQGFFNEDIAFSLGMFFSTSAGEKHGLNLAEEARRVLESYPNRPNAHERLQLLISVVSADLSNCDDFRKEFENAINEFHAHLDGLPETELKNRKYREGKIFSFVATFIRNLFETGPHRLPQELVRLWKRLPEDDFLNENVLMVIPNRALGVGYAHRTQSQMATLEFEDSRSRWGELLDAKNEALGDTHQLLNDDSFELRPVDRGRRDVPNYPAGSRFELAMQRCYLPDGMIDFLVSAIPECKGLAMIPYFSHPLPALLAKHAGKTLPFISSWGRPFPDKLTRRVLIYAGHSMSAETEVEELVRIFSKAGIECKICPAGNEGWEEFLQGYASDNFDVIWIISHGEIDPISPHLNYLSPHTDVQESPEAMPSIHASDTRRLLVLNVCSGGKGAALGGLPDVGIAHTLVDPRQAVVAHLWPVNPFVAAYFGIHLALEITKHTSYFEAYSKTLITLISTAEFRSEALHEMGCSSDSIDRFERNTFDLENILHWGSSVFIQ